MLMRIGNLIGAAASAYWGINIAIEKGLKRGEYFYVYLGDLSILVAAVFIFISFGLLYLAIKGNTPGNG